MERVVRTYDDMADRDVYMGPQWAISEKKQGSARLILTAACYFTDEKDVDLFWLLLRRHDLEWLWTGDPSGILRMDDERVNFVGEIGSTDTYWTESTSIFTVLDDSVLQVYEEVHIPFAPELLEKFANASALKIRLAGSDFELPMELAEDAKEILNELKKGGKI